MLDYPVKPDNDGKGGGEPPGIHPKKDKIRGLISFVCGSL